MPAIDLSRVPGLPAAALAALAAREVFTTFDILRVERAALSQASGVGLDVLLRLHALGVLAEVEGLDAARAQALLAAGIDRLHEFCGKPIAELRAVLQQGSAPMGDDAIIQAMVSARHLLSSGVLNGTVLTAGGALLAGATAAIGGQSAVSDAQGRFRLSGLSLGHGHALSLSHPHKRAKLFKGVAVYPSAAVVVRVFRLSGQPAPEPRLSALHGDVLPGLGTAPVTTEMMQGPLDPQDRFVLAERYANGDGKLASLFFDYQGGRFVVRCYRLPAADLPAGAGPGARLLLQAGGLVMAKVTAGKIGRLTRTRAVKRALAGQAATASGLEAAAAALINALNPPKGG